MGPAYVLAAFFILLIGLGIYAHFHPEALEPKEPGE